MHADCALLHRLKVPDQSERHSGMAQILSELRQAASQDPTCKFVESSVHVAVRLSRECPLGDVREEMEIFLQFLREVRFRRITFLQYL